MKSQLLIREFARLTGVTVRTLRYYDAIGLLRPSGRRPNGYRVYAPADLFRLQQVVALKFLGFALGEIRRILAQRGLSAAKSFRAQAEIISEEVRRLERASRIILQVNKALAKGKTLDWQKIIAIIKEMQMDEDTKKGWAEKFFTPVEMEEFREIGRKYTPAEMAAYEKRWTTLIEEVKANLEAEPASDLAQDLARRWQTLLDEGYGAHPDLKKRIGEAYKGGAVPAEYRTFGPEVWNFIARAMNARKDRKKG
jgi:DNA-binding transcriptional MerR regulator